MSIPVYLSGHNNRSHSRQNGYKESAILTLSPRSDSSAADLAALWLPVVRWYSLLPEFVIVFGCASLPAIQGKISGQWLPIMIASLLRRVGSPWCDIVHVYLDGERTCNWSGLPLLLEWASHRSLSMTTHECPEVELKTQGIVPKTYHGVTQTMPCYLQSTKGGGNMQYKI